MFFYKWLMPLAQVRIESIGFRIAEHPLRGRGRSRKVSQNRNLFQIVARIAHGPAGLIVGAGLVSAQIRAGTRPAPTRMANRTTICVHSKMLRQSPRACPSRNDRHGGRSLPVITRSALGVIRRVRNSPEFLTDSSSQLKT